MVNRQFWPRGGWLRRVAGWCRPPSPLLPIRLARFGIGERARELHVAPIQHRRSALVPRQRAPLDVHVAKHDVVVVALGVHLWIGEVEDRFRTHRSCGDGRPGQGQGGGDADDETQLAHWFLPRLNTCSRSSVSVARGAYRSLPIRSHSAVRTRGRRPARRRSVRRSLVGREFTTPNSYGWRICLRRRSLRGG